MERDWSSIAWKMHVYIRIMLWRNNNYSHLGKYARRLKFHRYIWSMEESYVHRKLLGSMSLQYHLENVHKKEAYMISNGSITRNGKEVWKHVTTWQKTANPYEMTDWSIFLAARSIISTKSKHTGTKLEKKIQRMHYQCEVEASTLGAYKKHGSITYVEEISWSSIKTTKEHKVYATEA